MDTKEVLGAYCRLMERIKQRTDIILNLADNSSGLPDFCAVETQQLQIRMICETLAIGCLLVHRDVEGARSSKLASAYQADFIMNALEKLHPRFYPHPVKEVFRDGKLIGFDDLKDGFLTKDELLKSYRGAAQFLHAGDISDFLAGKERSLDTDAAKQWVKRLIVLLNLHKIALADAPDAWEGREQPRFTDGEPAPRFQLFVSMRREDTDRPAASIFESIGQGPMTPPI